MREVESGEYRGCFPGAKGTPRIKVVNDGTRIGTEERTCKDSGEPGIKRETAGADFDR